MKGLFLLTAFTISILSNTARADFYRGDAAVGFDNSKGAIEIRGSAALGLFNAMSEVPAVRIDGQNVGYMKAGKNYLCFQPEQKASLETRCYMQITHVENGSLGEM